VQKSAELIEIKGFMRMCFSCVFNELRTLFEVCVRY
jgi:hypothetical protein